MNNATIITLLILAAAVALLIRHVRKSKVKQPAEPGVGVGGSNPDRIDVDKV